MRDIRQPRGHLMGFSSLAELLKGVLPENQDRVEEGGTNESLNSQASPELGRVAVTPGTDFGGAVVEKDVKDLPDAVVKISEHLGD